MHPKFFRILLPLAALWLTSAAGKAYVFEMNNDQPPKSVSWTRDRTVQMQLSLSGPPAPSGSDGFTTFNQSAEDALHVWNPYLAHLDFLAVKNSPVHPSDSDDEMSVLFSSTVFGKDWGANTLAITLLTFRGTVMEETDTLFNTHYTWDSYRGPLRPGVVDFHRVAIHEFGHTLGLDHPDNFGQTVTAIMNANVSSIDTVQQDDINGVKAIYSTGPAYNSGGSAPVMLNISTRAFSGTGDNVLIGGFIVQGPQPATLLIRGLGGSLRAFGITGVLPDPTLTIYGPQQHQIAASDDWFTQPNAAQIATYRLDPPNSIESATIITLNPGSYTAIVQSYSDSTQPAEPGIALVEIYDLHLTNSRLGNISTRGLVQGGDKIMIGGFIVGPGSTKPVVVRALGPSVGDAGVANFLADPTVELRDQSGNLVASNDNWQDGPNASQINGEGFAPHHPSESALQVTVTPGNYTALVRGAGGGSGVALVEVYDLSRSP